MNDQTKKAVRDSLWYKLTLVEDSSKEIDNVLVKSLEWNMVSREWDLSGSDWSTS
jgi:hypothetical protein